MAIDKTERRSFLLTDKPVRASRWEQYEKSDCLRKYTMVKPTCLRAAKAASIQTWWSNGVIVTSSEFIIIIIIITISFLFLIPSFQAKRCVLRTGIPFLKTSKLLGLFEMPQSPAFLKRSFNSWRLSITLPFVVLKKRWNTGRKCSFKSRGQTASILLNSDVENRFETSMNRCLFCLFVIYLSEQVEVLAAIQLMWTCYSNPPTHPYNHKGQPQHRELNPPLFSNSPTPPEIGRSSLQPRISLDSVGMQLYCF